MQNSEPSIVNSLRSEEKVNTTVESGVSPQGERTTLFSYIWYHKRVQMSSKMIGFIVYHTTYLSLFAPLRTFGAE
jgi:hypothetical protein